MTDGWAKGVGRGDGPSSRLVEHIQHLIINQGYSLSPHGADGRFGQLTESRVKEFQLAAGLPITGVVDRATFDALRVSGKEATVLTTDVPDVPGPAEGPQPPPFPPLVGNDQRAAIFGRISYVPAPTSTCPEGIRILGDWTEKHICTALVPQLAMIPGVEHHGSLVAQGPASGHVLVHKLIKPQLVDLWQAWEDAQLLDRVLTWHGLWAPRFIRGSRTVLSNHCLPPTETVWTVEGPVPIGDLKGSSAKVWAYSDGNTVIGNVSRFFENGVKPILKVKASGHEFQCTPDHPVLVLRKRTLLKEAWIQHAVGRGQRRALYWTEMVPAGTLRVGDRVVGSRQLPVIPVQKEIDLDWAEILGLFLGDGCIHHLHGKAEYVSFIFPESDRVRAHVVGLLTCYFGEEPKANSRSLCYYRERIWHNFLPYDKPAQLKTLPREVWNWSAAAKVRLLLGLLYSDGTIAASRASTGDGFSARFSFKMSSRPLVEAIRMLMVTLGFRVSKVTKTKGKEMVIAGVTTVSGEAFAVQGADVHGVLRPEADLLYLARVEAASKPNAWTSRCYGYETVGPDFVHYKVTSVEEIGAGPVVDIEVDDHHNFITGGVVVSNCYATAFDVNAPWNALGAKPAPRGTRGSVVELVALAHKHGFFWGGHFRRTDGMHFEAALVR